MHSKNTKLINYALLVLTPSIIVIFLLFESVIGCLSAEAYPSMAQSVLSALPAMLIYVVLVIIINTLLKARADYVVTGKFSSLDYVLLTMAHILAIFSPVLSIIILTVLLVCAIYELLPPRDKENTNKHYVYTEDGEIIHINLHSSDDNQSMSLESLGIDPLEISSTILPPTSKLAKNSTSQVVIIVLLIIFTIVMFIGY